MSNYLFPTLRGMSPKITKTPTHNTLRKVSQNGTEVRAKLMAYPRYQYKLSFEYLLDNGDQDSDLRTLLGFYNQRGGSFDNFLLLDKSDCTANNQPFAKGDGIKTTFRLVKNYGGFVEPLYGVDTSSTIFVDGKKATNVTINIEGTVVFNTPPAVGADLSWSGIYYHRVVFDEDSNDFDQIFSGLWELSTIKLMSDRG